MEFKLNLQRFTEMGGGGEGSAAPAAPAETAPAAESAESPEIRAGDILPNGQQASQQVAAAMNRQMKHNPGLRKVYGQGQKAGAPAAEQPQAAQGNAAEAGRSIEDRWNELKKGEFAELYGRDVQGAIQDRFKNQQDSSQALGKLEPMLKVLRDRAGVESNDDLIKHVLDDDSLYEEAAAEADMPVAAYKQFKQMEAQLEEAKKREQEGLQQQFYRNHIGKLFQQAETFKQQFPNFDLQTELRSNPQFAKLTGPEIGMSVEDAYFAVHHKELAPQMMAYGMERARQQMGQTIQAQRGRPAEGAMKTQVQPAAQMKLDPRKMTRAEREEIKRQVRLGKRVSFD